MDTILIPFNDFYSYLIFSLLCFFSFFLNFFLGRTPKRLKDLGFKLYATPGTADVLRESDVTVEIVYRIMERMATLRLSRRRYRIVAPRLSRGRERASLQRDERRERANGREDDHPLPFKNVVGALPSFASRDKRLHGP